MDSVVLMDDVSFRYEEWQGISSILALQKVTLQVHKGEFVGILGHNGSGKSTLAKHINALLVPVGGKVTVLGKDASLPENKWDIRREAGMVFQHPDHQIVGTTVEDDVVFGLENYGVHREKMKDLVNEALHAVRMHEYRSAEPHTLSGGQKQRVAIAGVLAMKPSVLILDEATAMLDPQGRTELLETVLRLNREQGMTVIWITHYPEEVVEADQLLVMNQGEVVLQGPPAEVFQHQEQLRNLSLEIPFAIDLANRLRNSGLPIPKDMMRKEQLVELLWTLLSEH